VQVLRASFGMMREGTGCMHSNRLPGLNDAHWAHARRSTPHFPQRLSAVTAAVMMSPQREQRKTSRKPGML
jgi:hypothetical protein